MTKTDPNETPLDGTRAKKKTESVRQILDAQMFTVENHEAELFHLNTRTERHGEDNVPASDLKFVIAGPHSMIQCFGEGLIEFLFREPGVGEDRQTAMDLGGDKRTKVRYPKIKPVTMDDEFPGYTVMLSAGLETGQGLTFKDAKLKAFKFKAIDGGAVEVTFSAAVYPDEHQAGVLFGWQKKTLVLTLQRPKAASEQQARLN